jgi:hypothetical protein
MKKALRIIAALLLAGAMVFWAAVGANRGWTKTSVPQKVTDPTTGLEGVQWQHQFVPGVDFLGLAGLGAAALIGVSFLFRKNQNHSTIQTKP